MDSIQPGLDEGHVPGGMGHPGLQQSLSHDSLRVVQQPQQGALLAAIITVPQDFQLPAEITLGLLWASRRGKELKVVH